MPDQDILRCMGCGVTDESCSCKQSIVRFFQILIDADERLKKEKEIQKDEMDR